MIVDRLAGGVDEEHVSATDGLVQRNRNLTVGKGFDLAVTQADAQLFADGLGKLRIGITGKDFKFIEGDLKDYAVT